MRTILTMTLIVTAASVTFGKPVTTGSLVVAPGARLDLQIADSAPAGATVDVFADGDGDPATAYDRIPIATGLAAGDGTARTLVWDTTGTVAGERYAAQVIVDREAVLLVSFDLPYPEPMGRVRRIHGALGVALLLTRTASDQCMARMTINIDAGGMPSRTAEPELERLRRGNPTGHALPLLAALAGDASAAVRLPYIAQQTLKIEVTPFSAQDPD